MDPAQRPWIVVLGASAGGLTPLRTFVSRLDPDLPVAVLVVLHIAAAGHSVLASILARAGPLPAHPVTDRTALQAGHIYVATADRHLLVDGDHVVVSDEPREKGHRPAIDVTLRSAAGPRTIGVVLSGSQDDGTAGLSAVKAAGGRTAVQDPAEAEYKSMPLSAIEHVDVDIVGGAADLAAAVTAWTTGESIKISD